MTGWTVDSNEDKSSLEIFNPQAGILYFADRRLEY